MFIGCVSLVGGAGTEYNPAVTDASRAHIDRGTNDPGYFTLKRQSWEGDVNSNGILNIVDAQIAYDIATTDMYKTREDYAAMYAAADVDWDGAVDAKDAFAIQYAALRGWESV